MALLDFYRGATKDFEVAITTDNGGTIPDISADRVALFIKDQQDDADAAALCNEDGNCAVQGSAGIAVFSLTTSITDIAYGQHYYEVVWYPDAGGEHIVEAGKVRVLERVSDV